MNAPSNRLISQLEKVLNLEREIKRTQMSLIVRIKNEFSAEQQARLRKIREEKEQERRRLPKPNE